jgi:hypothetical protein
VLYNLLLAFCEELKTSSFFATKFKLILLALNNIINIKPRANSNPASANIKKVNDRNDESSK